MFKKSTFQLSALFMCLGVGALMLMSNTAQALTDQDITVRQIDDQLIISVDNFDNPSDLEWQYAVASQGASCDEDLAFSSDRLVINDKTAYLQFNLFNYTYCFLITDTINNQSILVGHLTEDESSAEIPIIIVSRPTQNSLQVRSSNTDLNHASWHYESFSRDPNCQIENISRQLPANNLNVTLSNADSGKWFCFRVANIDGQYGFAEYKVRSIDNTPPRISIEQNNRILIATADETITLWSYIYSSREFACTESSFVNNSSAINNRSRITLTINQANHHFCFKATDQYGNTSTSLYRVQNVDFSTPKFDLYQQDYKIYLKDVSQNIKAWQYVKSDNSKVCNQTVDFSLAWDFEQDEGISITEQDHQKYFCIRATNEIDTYGHNYIRVDTKGAPISLKLTDNVLTASSSESEVDFEYLKSTDEIKCTSAIEDKFNQPNIDYHVGHKTTLYTQDNGSRLCFRAKDRLGNYSYKKYEVKDIDALVPGEVESTSRGSSEATIITIVLSILMILIIAYYVVIRPKQIAKLMNKSSSESNNSATKPAEEVQPLDYMDQE